MSIVKVLQMRQDVPEKDYEKFGTCRFLCLSLYQSLSNLCALRPCVIVCIRLVMFKDP